MSGPERDEIWGVSDPKMAGSRVSGVCCKVNNKQTDEVWDTRYISLVLHSELFTIQSLFTLFTNYSLMKVI